jgi:PKHD-type hydroxylase
MLLQVPNVLGSTEVASIRRSLEGAQFTDGRDTAGPGAREVKRNVQLPMDAAVSKTCAAIVLEALRRNPIFFAGALPCRIQGPSFNRYDIGMTYGDHVDNAVMQSTPLVRSDLAATLFLSDKADYDGGELAVNDTYGAHKIKLDAGSMILYPAGSIHHVEPVTRGSRLAAVLWIQSMVRDDARRRLLVELDITIGGLRQKTGTSAEVTTLTSIYHNLLRMWAET